MIRPTWFRLTALCLGTLTLGTLLPAAVCFTLCLWILRRRHGMTLHRRLLRSRAGSDDETVR